MPLASLRLPAILLIAISDFPTEVLLPALNGLELTEMPSYLGVVILAPNA
jgi:hypothetical protein